MIKIKASLEAVKTRKNITDDVICTVSFNVYGDPIEVVKIAAFYKLPLEITLDVAK